MENINYRCAISRLRSTSSSEVSLTPFFLAILDLTARGVHTVNSHLRFRTCFGSPRIATLFRSLLVMLFASALLVPLQRGNAATISVNTFNDVVAIDGACSLREAITSVNTHAASGNMSGECAAGNGNTDTVVLAAGTYHLTITGANEDLNATGDPRPAREHDDHWRRHGQHDHRRNRTLQRWRCGSRGADCRPCHSR